MYKISLKSAKSKTNFLKQTWEMQNCLERFLIDQETICSCLNILTTKFFEVFNRKCTAAGRTKFKEITTKANAFFTYWLRFSVSIRWTIRKQQLLMERLTLVTETRTITMCFSSFILSTHALFDVKCTSSSKILRGPKRVAGQCFSSLWTVGICYWLWKFQTIQRGIGIIECTHNLSFPGIIGRPPAVSFQIYDVSLGRLLYRYLDTLIPIYCVIRTIRL
jgi:hypothetical protein